MAAERRLVALALATSLAACGSGSAEVPRRPGGSTRVSVLHDPTGSGHLVPGPGEPLVARTDLAPSRRAGRVLVRFAQISDAHVRDEESPARLPFLDRVGRPFDSTFRPQEALTAQVLAASVRSVNLLRPRFVVLSGDLADSDQANELELALGVLHGGRIDPDSGAPGYAGVQSAGNPDPFYYRPDLDPPRFPGLLAAAERPFVSPGLRARWLPVLGNHDGLVDGELRPTARTRAVATGDRALPEPPPGLPLTERRRLERLLTDPLPSGTVRTTADPRRRELGADAAARRLRSAAHAPGTGGFLDYSVSVAPGVRLIALDLVSRRGGSTGVVHPGQVAWLRRALASAGGDRILLVSHQPLTATRGGGAVLAALDADPHVVAAIAGHTHRAEIRSRHTADGGYWLITAPSLVDFPQQARAFELRAAAGGGVVLDTWLLDTAPSPLADTARELAELDAQGGRPQGFAGRREDRNARLFVP